MKKTLQVIFFIILFTAMFSGFAQQHGAGSKRTQLIDSLTAVLNSLASPSDELKLSVKGQKRTIETDTIRIKTLNKLAWEFSNFNTDTAIALSKDALALAQNYISYTSPSKENQEKVRNDVYKLIGKTYVQMGIFAKQNDNYTLALDYNFKALELFDQMEKDTALNPLSAILERKSVILGNIGAIYASLGNYPKALENHFKALKYSELLGNKALIGTKYTNIGIAYHYQNDHRKALQYHQKALQIAEQINNKTKIANSLSNIGIAYRHLGEYTKAINNHLKALEIDKELEDYTGIPRHYINLAGIYYDKRDFNKVLEYDTKALEVYEKLKSKSGIALALGNIGSTQILLKKYKEAEDNLQKALAISTEIKALSLIQDHEQFLYDLYSKSGQPGKALEHYKQYTAIKDSIFNEENTKKTVRSEMNFEFEKKQAFAKAEQEKQAAIAQKEKQKQQIILFFVSCFLLLVVVFAVFMYKRWHITQKQKAIIEKQKEKIIDSINYAQFIQESILIEETEIQKHLPDSFIYFQPKDIVSGDFYWFSRIVGSLESGVRREQPDLEPNNKVSELRTPHNQPNKQHSEFRTTDSELLIIAAADCTGHGVPGAFMSMIGNTLLNQIVNEKHITSPSEILACLSQGIYEALHPKQGATRSRDGMDIALCCIDYKNNLLLYSGAKSPLYIIMDNELTVINADRQTIGANENLLRKGATTTNLKYTSHSIPIKKNMSVYMFSDGYADQFGGKDHVKLGSRKFKELLLSIQQHNMIEQKDLIVSAHKKWKADTQQIDDILVIGIKL